MEERRWVFRHHHEEVVLVARRAASKLELALAEERGEATRLVEQLLSQSRRHPDDGRSALIAMADVGREDARWYSTAALERLVFDRVGRAGQLLVVREVRHEPHCGTCHEPESKGMKLDIVPRAPLVREAGTAPALARSPTSSPATSIGATGSPGVSPGTSPATAPVARDLAPTPLAAKGLPSTPAALAPGPSAPVLVKRIDAQRAAPQHAPANDDPGWVGDSSKWSLEKKLLSLHPDLRPKVVAVLEALTQRGFQPKVFFAWRSVAVQLEIFEKGNTKVKFSFHNAQKRDGTPNAYAVDIVDSRWGWGAKAATEGFWTALGEEAKVQGLYWGGDWKTFRDWAHVQLTENWKLKQVKKESGL
jgi:hypothetical protein